MFSPWGPAVYRSPAMSALIDSNAPSIRYGDINRFNLRARPARAVGDTITEWLNDSGEAVPDESNRAYGISAAHFVPETQHTIASVFWDFMHAEELVQEA